MAQVVKRTGEPVKFKWTFDPAKEVYVTEFRLEKADGSVVQGGIPKTARELNAVAGSQNESFKLAAVNGTLAAYAVDTVDIVIDNTPPAPTDFTAE